MLVEFMTIKENEILHIKLEQSYDLNQGKDLLSKVREKINKASNKNNLVVGVDMTQVQVFSPEIIQILESCQKLFVEYRVKKIGTLIQSSILEMQLRRTAKQNYPEEIQKYIQRFQNREDWENFLSSNN